MRLTVRRVGLTGVREVSPVDEVGLSFLHYVSLVSPFRDIWKLTFPFILHDDITQECSLGDFGTGLSVRRSGRAVEIYRF